MKCALVFAALSMYFAYTAYKTWLTEFAGNRVSRSHSKGPSNKEMLNVKLGATVKEAVLKAANLHSNNFETGNILGHLKVYELPK